LELLGFFAREGLSYDIFQFYFGISYTGPGLHEISFLKRLGKKIYFYFCGCDVRDSKTVIQRPGYNACSHCWPMLCSPNRKKSLSIAERYADANFVSTPDLLEFVPGALLLPQPIDLEAFARISSEVCMGRHSFAEKKRVTIAHAPSNQSIKGTKYLLQAIEAMQKKGLPVNLVLIEGKSYLETIRVCAMADIVVDQLLIGAYGQFAVEMMALGKPVVCYIRENLMQYYPPGLPILSATPENIESVLSYLIENREEWSKRGSQGVAYVKANHDSMVIAQQLIAYYHRGV
jgi:glycosyltransferase involved in cell wall biosynthesis